MEWNTQGNIFIRPNAMNKGDVIHGHKHHFDHVSIALRGSFSIKATLPSGKVVEKQLFSPSSDVGMDRAHALIKAGIEHEITALEDNSVFWCVYAHRTPQGDVVQDFTGWQEAYN